MWQTRAAHLEDRLLALGAGDTGQDAPVAAPSSQQDVTPAEVDPDVPVPWWKFWERWQ